MPGEFSFKRFCKRLRIPKGERSLIEDLFARGLEKYYYDLYGYDKYGPHPEFLINERMGEPYIFGYGAVQVLRHADISDDTKRRMAEYTLSIVRPREEYGVPFGLAVAVSYLASHKALDGRRLERLIRSIGGDREAVRGLKVKDGEALVDALLSATSLPAEKRADLLHFLLIRFERSPNVGKAAMARAMAHPALPDEWKKQVCNWIIDGRSEQRPSLAMFDEILKSQPPFRPFSMAMLGLSPTYLMRAAVLWLARLGEEPLALCERYLDTGRPYESDALSQGVADVILEFHAQMPPQKVRELMERGVKFGKAAVRKRFYAVGLELYGPDFVRPALEDGSKRVRTWAQKQLLD